MTLLMTCAIAINALRRNALRTALTALGMIIGVASVIVMVAIGSGAQESIEAQIRSAGSNLVIVTAGSSGFGPVRQGLGATTSLTAADADAIRAELAGLRYLSPASTSARRSWPRTPTGEPRFRERENSSAISDRGPCSSAASLPIRTSRAQPGSPCSEPSCATNCSGPGWTRPAR